MYRLRCVNISLHGGKLIFFFSIFWKDFFPFYIQHCFICRPPLDSTVTQDHRVGRVLSFFSSRWNWDSPTPPLQASVPSPSPRFWGGGTHSLAREGLGESQFRRGGIHCGTLYIYVLCAQDRCNWHALTVRRSNH